MKKILKRASLAKVDFHTIYLGIVYKLHPPYIAYFREIRFLEFLKTSLNFSETFEKTVFFYFLNLEKSYETRAYNKRNLRNRISRK